MRAIGSPRFTCWPSCTYQRSTRPGTSAVTSCARSVGSSETTWPRPCAVCNHGTKNRMKMTAAMPTVRIQAMATVTRGAQRGEGAEMRELVRRHRRPSRDSGLEIGELVETTLLGQAEIEIAVHSMSSGRPVHSSTVVPCSFNSRSAARAFGRQQVVELAEEQQLGTDQQRVGELQRHRLADAQRIAGRTERLSSPCGRLARRRSRPTTASASIARSASSPEARRRYSRIVTSTMVERSSTVTSERSDTCRNEPRSALPIRTSPRSGSEWRFSSKASVRSAPARSR